MSDQNHDLDVAKGEAVEMFAATVQAWFATAMEFDRALVTLAAAAIGLLVALATSGVTSLQTWEAVLFSVALILFCLALACTLTVFKKNKAYLEEMVEKRAKARKSHPALVALDWVGLISFVAGAVLAITVAISAVFKKTAVDPQMTDKTSQTSFAQDSLNKALAMHPDFGKSLNGAAGLQPSVPSAGQAAAPAAPASAPAPAAQSSGTQTK